MRPPPHPLRRRRPRRTSDRIHPHHIHSINLFQAAILTLNHKEVNDEEQRQTATRKHEPIQPLDRRNDTRREEADQKVPKPITRRRERHARAPVFRRVELGDDGPDQGAPGGRERNDEQAAEDD